MNEEKTPESVEREFPYTVQRRSVSSLELEIGQWVCENVGADMIVLSKKAASTAPWSSILITYGFKYEPDAIAFKLKFGHEPISAH